MPTFAALPVIAFLVAPPVAPDDGCPSARQVTDALQAHVAGSLVSPDAASGAQRPDVLRAVLDIPSDGTVVRFSLVDGRGDTQLRRTLPATGRGHTPSDCAALAETLAEIVERYLASIAFLSPETDLPPPPPRPPAETVVVAPVPSAVPPPGERAILIGAGGAWRMSTDGRTALGGRLVAVVELTRSAHPLALVLGVGANQSDEATFPTGSATLQQFPMRIGLLVEIPAGPGTIEPAAAAGIDLFLGWSSDTVQSRNSNSGRVSPAGDIEVGYRIALANRFFIRPRASLGMAIVRYSVTAGGANNVIFDTPGTYSTFGIDAGMVFR